MSRLLTLVYGSVVYLLFLLTFLCAIGFVEDVPGLKTIDGGAEGELWAALLIDIALLGLFAVQHSVMARRGFKEWWTRFIPQPVERSTFVLASSARLGPPDLAMAAHPRPGVVGRQSRRPMAADRPVPPRLGDSSDRNVSDQSFRIVRAAADVRILARTSLRAAILPDPALYRVVRHPIYLGFLLAFWATPHMTAGHLLFATMTTGYILVGIFFEERDLIARFGDQYRRYRAEVGMLLPRLGVRRARQAVAKQDWPY